jgi:hypothetical protein
VSQARYEVSLVERAKSDVLGLTDRDRYLWTAAKERLRRDATPDFELTDPHFTSGPPVKCYRAISGDRVIVVEYKHLGNQIEVLELRFYYYGPEESPTR